MRRFSIQLVFVCLGAFTGALAASPSPIPSNGAPVALVSQVELKTTTVSLSDLLPADAPAPLRTASVAISLGSAPMAGNVRRMTREEIEHALLDQPQILAGITVPANVTIRRVDRPLSREEVAAAINAALGAEHAVDPASLNLQLSPLVTSDDPGLEVTSVEFDTLHQVTRFRLWTAKEPEKLPFCVTISGRLMGGLMSPQGTPQAPAAAERRAAHPAEATTASVHSEIAHSVVETGDVKSSAKESEALVKAGVATRLVIEGADYRLTSTVIPLEPGTLGQEIRVRDPLTHKILSAQVAGPGLLKGSLEEKGL
jgi:hypothetical protein